MSILNDALRARQDRLLRRDQMSQQQDQFDDSQAAERDAAIAKQMALAAQLGTQRDMSSAQNAAHLQGIGLQNTGENDRQRAMLANQLEMQGRGFSQAEHMQKGSQDFEAQQADKKFGHDEKMSDVGYRHDIGKMNQGVQNDMDLWDYTYGGKANLMRLGHPVKQASDAMQRYRALQNQVAMYDKAVRDYDAKASNPQSMSFVTPQMKNDRQSNAQRKAQAEAELQALGSVLGIGAQAGGGQTRRPEDDQGLGF